MELDDVKPFEPPARPQTELSNTLAPLGESSDAVVVHYTQLVRVLLAPLQSPVAHSTKLDGPHCPAAPAVKGWRQLRRSLNDSCGSLDGAFRRASQAGARSKGYEVARLLQSANMDDVVREIVATERDALRDGGDVGRAQAGLSELVGWVHAARLLLSADSVVQNGCVSSPFVRSSWLTSLATLQVRPACCDISSTCSTSTTRCSSRRCGAESAKLVRLCVACFPRSSVFGLALCVRLCATSGTRRACEKACSKEDGPVRATRAR